MINSEDKYGLGTDLPYYAVKLTVEESKKIEFHKMEFYSTDGRTLFEFRGPDGKPTGEYMFFVVFKP